MKEEIEFHPLAEIFPLIEGKEFDDLVNDIETHGLRESIWIYDGKVLDGRNRYRALCELASPSFINAELDDVRFFRFYEGYDPAAFVVSLNLKRRHLNESQRAMVAARLANLGDGQRSDRVQGTSIEGASNLLNVGRASVERAKAVHRDGAFELRHAVEQGLVSVSAAADVATMPQAEQRQIVARGEKEILWAAKTIRAERAVASREVRLDNLAEISRGNTALNTSQRYPIIYADPPWRYENPPMGGTNRSIENHYPTMTLEELMALPVANLATDDAILYMWATAPKLAECIDLLRKWDFEYRTNSVWDKEMIGMGYHFRNQHELLLVGKRGNIPPPQAGTQPSSVHREKRGEHSVKPEFYYEMIEGAYPQLPKIELFCRSPRAGWSVWGNQASAA